MTPSRRAAQNLVKFFRSCCDAGLCRFAADIDLDQDG